MAFYFGLSSKGVQTNLCSLSFHGFSDIPLNKKTLNFIKTTSNKDKIYFDKKNYIWFIKLNKDKSCPFHKDGICSIYSNRPPICAAYPFYIDPFAGVCIDKSCPGVGAGWTNIKKLRNEYKPLKDSYMVWISNRNILNSSR